MRKNTKYLLYISILTTTGVVIVAYIGFALWQNHRHQLQYRPQYTTDNTTEAATTADTNRPTMSSTANPTVGVSGLADCPGTNIFSVSPVSSYDYATPLGQTSSYNGNPGHVIPVDHMYFYLNHTNPKNFNSPTIASTVVAPSNIVINQVTGVDPNSSQIGFGWRVHFTPCNGVTGLFDHIDNLAPTIKSAMVASASNKNGCQSITTAPNTPILESCRYQVDVELKAGDTIGTSGGAGTTNEAFDFGVYDSRIQPLAFVDPKYWTPNNLHAVCGISYYPEGGVKNSLYKSLKTTKVGADGLPDCGTNMWDKAGSIQGNWVLPGTQTGPIPDNKNGLSISRIATDPSKADIDWGGTIAPADRIEAAIVTGGIRNIDPANVTADGKVYCYDDATAHGVAYARSVFLQLTDSNTLKIQYHAGACPASPTLTNPTTYTR